jgi:branched-subunit amino acid transport protein
MKQSMPGTFTTNTNSALEFYCLLKFAVQSDEWSEDPRAVCEIMFDLSDYITNPAHTKLIICRPINRTPYFSALPLNADLFRVLFYLLAPVFCHDLSRLPAVVDLFHELVPWTVLFSIFVANILLSKVLLDTDFKNQVVGYGIIAIIAIGTFVAHPYSVQCFEFIAQSVLVFLYIKALGSYTLPTGLVNAIMHDGFCRKRVQILIAALGINALMLNWTLILPKFIDGSLFYQLLVSIAYIFVPIVNIIALDIMRISTATRKIELASLFTWPARGITELQFFGAVVLVTLLQCRSS